MGNKITTAGGFITSVEDVTVRPTRLQSEVNKEVKTLPENVSTIPQMLTLERAIKWYEENAVGEFESLFKYTANQLRNQLSANVEVKIER